MRITMYLGQAWIQEFRTLRSERPRPLRLVQGRSKSGETSSSSKAIRAQEEMQAIGHERVVSSPGGQIRGPGSGQVYTARPLRFSRSKPQQTTRSLGVLRDHFKPAFGSWRDDDGVLMLPFELCRSAVGGRAAEYAAFGRAEAGV